MKVSNFLFPQAEPDSDGQVIDDALKEAVLCDELGMETVWLAEHHFDGNCAYVDPVAFAAALSTITKRIKLGFAVAQTSLHHPIRLAEQLSLIDNLAKGRLIVGLGRGTAHNIYDYRGYGIAPEEAHARLVEAEDIMIKAWTTENLEHDGAFWKLWLPMLRPRPYTKPHPFLIRASGSEGSMLDMARQGRPFMMNIQTDDVTRTRLDLYRKTMADAGFDDAHIAAACEQCWVWRNVFIAETDAEAERIGIPLFKEQREQRARMRNRILAERGESMAKPGETGVAETAARNVIEHSLIVGSPATVAERLAKIDAMGVGGVVLQFRVGPSSYELTENCIRLFMDKVAPEFSAR